MLVACNAAICFAVNGSRLLNGSEPSGVPGWGVEGLNEIDDIFASKGKVNPSQPSSSSKTPENRDKVTKKSSKKKRKREAAQEVKDTNDAEEHERPAKRKVPETVVDPSISLSAPVKQKKSAAPEKREGAVKKPKKKGDKEDEERFKDSRGTGPRRKTEEGFLIFKEDELGISGEGGDTPLCPFDCQCCKSL
ncbi:hypothetical protein BC629DRAFT_1588829 [Irpex lacteus]|nr:hypothetical protein BC629DRAFT_1588829 [Irpex lacteus]